jgi:hypothetical protein
VAGAVGGRSGAISAKYRSKPAGEMISNARAGASPAFQKARGAPLALKTRSPGRTTRTSSPRPGHRPHLRERRSTRPRVRGCEGARRGLEARSGALRARRCPALSTPDHEPCAEPAYHHLITTISPSSGDNTIRACWLPAPSMVILLLRSSNPAFYACRRGAWILLWGSPQVVY